MGKKSFYTCSMSDQRRLKNNILKPTEDPARKNSLKSMTTKKLLTV